ncbi:MULTISPECIES: MerR family transcriptional regulator [unclassified Streptomyces]|uniref:MerR family transcriptional regulator n=1 Tax=unclassified Streptomyces TaxID=2593676 RepID=UPI0007DCEFED|nr:MerR family transcriptional regulator [Streptomyces sp. SAT1]ANH90678.1 MerR family transcriptional regulator [Streptomyces sp. SAT1]
MTSGQPAPAGRGTTLTIAQVAERTGLSHDTLRYYERAGLIERVGRTTGNQRRYEAADLAWLEFLLRLRETGMSIADMQRFATLRAQGDATVPERLAMLREHRVGLADRIRALRRNAHTLDDKIDHYERLLHERRTGTEERT